MENRLVNKRISLLKPRVKEMMNKTTRDGGPSEIMKYLGGDGVVNGDIVSSFADTSAGAISFSYVNPSKAQVHHEDDLVSNLNRDCSNETSLDSLLSLRSQEESYLFRNEDKANYEISPHSFQGDVHNICDVTSAGSASVSNSDAKYTKSQCDSKTLSLHDNLAEIADILIVYRCKCCDKQFNSETALLRHVRMGKDFSENGQYGQTVYTSDDIIITPLPSQNKESFICGKCSKEFSDFSSCQIHIQANHAGSQPDCRSSGNTEPVLSLAITKVSNGKDLESELPECHIGNVDVSQNIDGGVSNILESSNDGSVSSVKEKGDRILQLEPLEKTHRCTVGGCGQRFHTIREVEIHVKCHNSDPSAIPKFICSHCEKTFPRWGECAMHLYKAHRVSAGLVTCAMCCTFKTYTAVRLRQHQETHSDQRSHVCPICHKGFKQAAQLINHRITHVPPAQRQNYKKSYQSRVCELCNKTFATPKIYSRHVKQVHNKIRPWWCDLCGHTAATKHALEVHKRIHTGEKPYSCDLCSYKTADHNTLRRHKMKHDGIKPYSCPHCPYTAIQTYSFKSHIKNYHPNLPGVFECPHCPFQSIREDALKSHIQSHNKGLLPIREKKAEDTVFPGNLAATQLLYNCLSALAENGDVSLPNSLESSICQKGSTQTITIHIPQYEENSQESVELGPNS